ncbi:MAG: hypothetical protein Q9174_001101 [Haloplaca sp. 1 TL-2023]
MTGAACPFCPFPNSSPYVLAQHVETDHPESDQPPFVPRDILQDVLKEEQGRKIHDVDSAITSSAPSDYIDCECGEAIPLADFDDHVQLHSAESADMAGDAAELLETLGPSPVPRSRPKQRPFKPIHRRQEHCTVKDWVTLMLGTAASPSRPKADMKKYKHAKRLGKAELGPYAHEDRMPAWLHRQLENGAKVSLVTQIDENGHVVRVETVANEACGILPVIAQLCEQDQMLSNVYLCHPGVQHVFKMAKEGGFCGYRNIQMMISFIQAAQSQGFEYFPGRVPSILDIQELIESAWDRGINAAGRVETGGIQGTRKYIGTPEVHRHSVGNVQKKITDGQQAQTLFTSLNIGYL